MAAAGVDVAVGAADGFGSLPANLLAVTGRLAVLFGRADDTLAAIIVTSPGADVKDVVVPRRVPPISL